MTDRPGGDDLDAELDGEHLPPELRAAWEERERDRLAAKEAEALAATGAGDAPIVERPAVQAEPKIPLAPIGTQPGRWWLPFVGLAVIVVALILVNTAGIPGWRAGAFIAGGPLLALAIAIEVVASRRLTLRAVYIVAAAAITLLGVARGVDSAPLSHGRIEATLDETNLAFFKQTSSARRGHGWCSPSCPIVTRRYDGPTRTIDATYLNVISALSGEGLVPYKAATLRLAGLNPGAIEVPGRRTSTFIGVAEVDGKIKLTLQVRSRRGRAGNPPSPRALKAMPA